MHSLHNLATNIFDSLPGFAMKRWFARLWSSSPRRPARCPRRLLPRLEPLEDRTVPANLVVTTLTDELNAGDGLTSLREAIAIADQDTVADTITFDPSLFTSGQTKTLTLSLPVASGGGQMIITKPMNIIGPGALELDIKQAISGSRIFQVRFCGSQQAGFVKSNSGARLENTGAGPVIRPLRSFRGVGYCVYFTGYAPVGRC